MDASIKKMTSLISTIFLSLSFSAHADFFSNQKPRLLLWGMSGSETIGRVDALLPIKQNMNSLFFTDLQGKIDTDAQWFSGIGLGYRQIVGNNIFGSYLFLDRTVSNNHNAYYILSPGIEALNFSAWDNFVDVRLNGYIPVSERRKNLEYFFPNRPNTCGLNGDCESIVFQGHKQFEHRFLRYEEVGPGADVEAGLHLPRLNNAALYAGGYYFQRDNFSDIKGIEGRVEIPLRSPVSLTVETSYDNLQKHAIVAGLMLRFGGTNTNTIQDRLYDRVVRNVATVASGKSVPIYTDTIDQGLFLTRDNIFFFTNDDGSLFDGTLQSGTFENPLAETEFHQGTVTTIDALEPNANFYFSQGSYVISPGLASAPNARIELLEGQSIFGRSSDFRCSAVGNERPIIFGGIDLFSGNNTIDSIRLENTITGPTSIVGLDIQNASNVVLCNDAITVSSNFVGDTAAVNSALGIRTNNSEVLINNSLLDVSANISGSSIQNQAVGIGDVTNGVENNRYIIVSSVINVASTLGNRNIDTGANQAVGIGIGNLTSANFTKNFFNNDFKIVNTNINILSRINESGIANNQAVAIGTATRRLLGNTISNENFQSNKFTIVGSIVNASANITQDNGGFNQTTLIGTLGASIDGTVTQNFESNNFLLQDSVFEADSVVNNNFFSNSTVGIGNITGTTLVGTYNQAFRQNEFTINRISIMTNVVANQNQAIQTNQTCTIGNCIFDGLSLTSDFRFDLNKFVIDSSEFLSIAKIEELNDVIAINHALNIGNNVGFALTGNPGINFEFNNFSISSSLLNASAIIGGNNSQPGISADNLANCIGNLEFNNNLFNIDTSSLTAFANVQGNNEGNNLATGFITGNNNIMNVLLSKINVNALVSGNNTGTVVTPAVNNATGFIAGAGTVFNLIHDQVNLQAIVSGINAGFAENSAQEKNGTGSFNDATTTYNVVVIP